MKKLKIKIEFECLSNKEETEETLNKIINYQIYEKIWNISNEGVKLSIKEKKPIQFKDIEVNVDRLEKLGIIKQGGESEK